MISNTDLKAAGALAPIAARAGESPTGFEFDVAHHVPGRLRLRSAALKGNDRACEQARRHLAQIGGVKEAGANPATGSVLLEYDPSVLSPDQAIEAFATHGTVLRANEREIDAGGKWADKLASGVMDWAINALAERLATAMITALV